MCTALVLDGDRHGIAGGVEVLYHQIGKIRSLAADNYGQEDGACWRSHSGAVGVKVGCLGAQGVGSCDGDSVDEWIRVVRLDGVRGGVDPSFGQIQPAIAVVAADVNSCASVVVLNLHIVQQRVAHVGHREDKDRCIVDASPVRPTFDDVHGWCGGYRAIYTSGRGCRILGAGNGGHVFNDRSRIQRLVNRDLVGDLHAFSGVDPHIGSQGGRDCACGPGVGWGENDAARNELGVGWQRIRDDHAGGIPKPIVGNDDGIVQHAAGFNWLWVGTLGHAEVWVIDNGCHFVSCVAHRACGDVGLVGDLGALGQAHIYQDRVVQCQDGPGGNIARPGDRIGPTIVGTRTQVAVGAGAVGCVGG